MILLLIGNDEVIKQKVNELKSLYSFNIHDKPLKNFDYYKKEYLKAIKNNENVIFTKHHIMSGDFDAINLDDYQTMFRTEEDKLKEYITVIYFRESMNQNSYALDYISRRLSRLNWLITKKDKSMGDILNNINLFNKIRIKNL